MKEVIKVIKELRGYPENSFVYPQEPGLIDDLKAGLVIVNLEGEEQGFIETGDIGTVLVEKG